MIMRLASICVLSLVLAFTGCTTYTGEFSVKTEEELKQMEREANTARTYFQSGNYAAADNILVRLGTDKTVSQPLYNLDRIPVLLLAGKKAEAHDLMMRVREDLETLYDVQLEERAQSIWHGEANKVYKGDAHERATLYAILALSFMDRGEYEDALRSVKNGLLSDCFGSDDVYNADFGLLHYLGWVCSLRCGETDTAERYRAAMVKSFEVQNIPLPPGTSLLSKNADSPNALVALWLGTPPSYHRDGKYGEKRAVLAGDGTQFDFVTVADASGREQIVPTGLGDVNFQATTRNGRLMDNVLRSKAELKGNFDKAAKTSLVLSGICFTAGTALLSGDKYLAVASLCCYGAGVCCLVLDAAFIWAHDNVVTDADTRFWQTLPGQLNLLPLKLPLGRTQLRVRGYIGGDVMMDKMVDVDVAADGATRVVHVPCVGNDILDKSAKLFNKSSQLAMDNAPDEPALNVGSLSNIYDTSASYAIIGTDKASHLNLSNLSLLREALSEAMVKHGYSRHYYAGEAVNENKNFQPDLVLGCMGERYWIRSVDGKNVLDTRVSIMVRHPGTLKDGKFNAGKVRFFYGWSRTPTEASLDNLTEGSKSIGRQAAIDNLFNLHDFRAVLSKPGAVVPQPLKVTQGAPKTAMQSSSTKVKGKDGANVTNTTAVTTFKLDEKSLVGRWKTSYEIRTLSFVQGREVKTSTPNEETLILNLDRTFTRVHAANGNNREFSGTWNYENGGLTLKTEKPVKKTTRYEIRSSANSGFDLRFADLNEYQNEIKATGKMCSATAEYLQDGTLKTEITAQLPGKKPDRTTLFQSAKIFNRISVNGK